MDVIGKLGTTQLLKTRRYLETINRREHRTFPPKGKWNKLQIRPMEPGHRFDERLAARLVNAIAGEVKRRVVDAVGAVRLDDATRKIKLQNPLVAWLADVHPTTTFTTSVCTGSLVLAAAGLLDGLTATTHWGAYDALAKLGAVPTDQRVVEHLDRRVITAAGVSSGIDMALRLSELLVDADAARAMQLMIEYDPQPPFDAGRVDKAGEAVMERVVAYAADKA